MDKINIICSDAKGDILQLIRLLKEAGYDVKEIKLDGKETGSFDEVFENNK